MGVVRPRKRRPRQKGLQSDLVKTASQNSMYCTTVVLLPVALPNNDFYSLNNYINDGTTTLNFGPGAPVGTGVVGTRAIGTGAVGAGVLLGTLGTGAVGIGAVGTGAVGTGAVGTGAVGTGAIGTGAMGPGPNKLQALAAPTLGPNKLQTLAAPPTQWDRTKQTASLGNADTMGPGPNKLQALAAPTQWDQDQTNCKPWQCRHNGNRTQDQTNCKLGTGAVGT
jgi:hypothetical protein